MHRPTQQLAQRKAAASLGDAKVAACPNTKAEVSLAAALLAQSSQSSTPATSKGCSVAI